jgi:hypothetical protein
MNYIMLNTDNWEDVGKWYRLVSLNRRTNSTATELVLEYNGKTFERVVAYHQIEWEEES